MALGGSELTAKLPVVIGEDEANGMYGIHQAASDLICSRGVVQPWREMDRCVEGWRKMLCQHWTFDPSTARGRWQKGRTIDVIGPQSIKPP